MPKTFPHVLSTSRKHSTGFLVKSFGEFCGSTVLTAACYWPSSHFIPAQKFVCASGNHRRSPWVLDSDKDACCHCFSLHILHQRWPNYGLRAASGPPTSLIRPAKYLANFFLNATFPTVDSSATALTAACHVNRTVSGPPVSRQSRIRPSGQNVWPPLQGRNEVRWRPGQEASLAPQCSNLRSFGSKRTVLKKVLVTLLGLFGASHSHSAPPQWFGARKIVPPLSSLATLQHPWFTRIVLTVTAESRINRFLFQTIWYR